VPIESVPKTATGKQDRNALKASMSQILAARHASKPALVPEGIGRESHADHKGGEPHLGAVLDAVHAAVGFRLRRGDDLFENGCTSIKAMRLAVAVKVPIAAIFAHPTPEAIAGLVAARHEPTAPAQHVELAPPPPVALQSTASAQPANPLVASVASVASRAIAITGMSVRLPGGVDSLGKLWQQLYAAADLTEDLPTALGDEYITRKGVVSVVGLPSTATLSVLQMPAEVARRMGPEQRVALELAVMALRDAGIDPSAAPARTGVFLSSSSLYHPTEDLDKMRTEQPDAYFGMPHFSRIEHARPVRPHATRTRLWQTFSVNDLVLPLRVQPRRLLTTRTTSRRRLRIISA
jgi:hypothetical protein